MKIFLHFLNLPFCLKQRNVVLLNANSELLAEVGDSIKQSTELQK
jgi:hypothetical protein